MLDQWRIVNRAESLKWGSAAIFLAAFGISLLISAILLAIQDKPGLTGVLLLLEGGFGHLYSIEDALLKAIPIFLCATGVALCFRMQIWNIGAEGQYVLGCLGGTWFVLNFPELPVYILMPGMLIFAMLFAALWAAIPAILRQKWGMNEIITTLMLNYIGIGILNHFIYGSWRDPAGLGFPHSATFPDAAIIGSFIGRVHYGLLTCIFVGLLYTIFLNKTRIGFEIKIAGSNAQAAHYAKMPYSKLVLLVMMLCGALAGLAGIQECSTILNRLEPNIASGYGFTAVIVAWLARFSIIRIALFAFILAGLRVGVENLQIELQISNAFASALEGFILLTVLAGQFFDSYSFKRKKATALAKPRAA